MDKISVTKKLKRGYDEAIIDYVSDSIECEGAELIVNWEALARIEDSERMDRVYSILDDLEILEFGEKKGNYSLVKSSIEVGPRVSSFPCYFRKRRDAEEYRKYFFEEKGISKVHLVHYLD